MSCRKTKSLVENVMFDPQRVSQEDRRHLAECQECARELADFESTIKVLDDWLAPDPEPFFDAKLRARLRRERERTPEGFLARCRSRLLYGSHFRPRQWAAATLSVAMVLGAGSYALVSYIEEPTTPQLSATVRDLKSFDSDQQLFQQLNALDAPAENASGTSN